MGKKVKVAFCSANPQDSDEFLDIDEELRQIGQRLDSSTHGDRFELVPVPAATHSDLINAFNKHQPDVLHFCGHGSEHGIYLRGVDRELEILTGEELAEFIGVLAIRATAGYSPICSAIQRPPLLRFSGNMASSRLPGCRTAIFKIAWVLARDSSRTTTTRDPSCAFIAFSDDG